jgi:hypothetical protein
MSRKALPRLLGAAATVALLVLALTAVAGTGFAAGNAAQANYAPVNTAAPSISGSPQVGQTLTASNGTWNSETTPTYTYQWQRCDTAGNNCANISNATGQTYKVTSDDSNKTLRVVVTAHNSTGTTSATSAQTSVVGQTGSSGASGAIKTASGATSVPASSVALPERLIINGVKFTPRIVASRNPFTLRVHVVDTRGYLVRDALVKATALPYAWAKSPTEVRTDVDGWASITVTPSRFMPLSRNALVFQVRARVEGQSLLAGSSSRRLIQVSIR